METKQTLINDLIKILALQLQEAGNAPLGLTSTYKKFAECSKTVAQLENLGVEVDTAFETAKAH
jgi:hypothetical protein